MPLGPYPDFASCVAGVKQSYRRSHPDWTEDHLNQVSQAVCGQMEKQSRQGLRVAYQAKFDQYSEGDRHFIKVYNIDDSWNQNNWAVTPEARARSLRSFFDQPLLGPPELSKEHVIDADPTHPHHGEWAKIGRPVDVLNNGATYGIYEVTVPEAWSRIQAGELSAVSPSVLIMNEVRQPDGRNLITDFLWDHTLFVDVPAFPKAGVTGTCTAADPSLCSFGQAAQAAYARRQGLAIKIGNELVDLVFSPEDFEDIEHFVKQVAEFGITEADARKAWAEQQQVMRGQAPTGARQDVAEYSDPEGKPSNSTKTKPEDTQGGVFVKNAELSAQAADAWNTADAPDKFFAVVPDSAKGPDGKKSDRKLPLASVQKKDLDEKIIRDAISRLPQTDFAGTGSSMAAAKAKICEAARSISLDLPSCQSGQGEVESGENKLTDQDKEQGCRQAQAKIETDLAQANAKIKELDGKLQARDDLELTEKAVAVADQEIAAGFVQAEKRAEEITRLKGMGASALRELQARYAEMNKKLQAAKESREPHKLKADFDEAIKDPAQASSIMEQVRQARFGVVRSPEDLAKLERVMNWDK